MKKVDLYMRMLKLLNVLLILIPFSILWFYYYSGFVTPDFSKLGTTTLIFIYIILYLSFGRVYNIFWITIQQKEESFFGQIMSMVLSNLIIYLVIGLIARIIPTFYPLVLITMTQIIIAYLWTTGVQKWYFKRYQPKKTVVIYEQEDIISDLAKQYGLNKRFDIYKRISSKDCVQNFSEIDGAEVIFLTSLDARERNEILKYAVNNNITIYIIPRVGDALLNGATAVNLFHLPMLHVKYPSASIEYLFLKRILDIILSLIGLILSIVIMIPVALLIKLEDKGPIFYYQTRLTKNEQPFKMIKFRSMRTDAESDGVARLSTGKNDARISKIGKIIRPLRIDELPQFINVLKGDLSIVGPRPERPEIVKIYEEHIPEFKLRMRVKGGLTGYAQVYGKYNTTPANKLQMDLMYISNPSILKDIKIILATLKILFLSTSTEGIEKNKDNAL